MMRCASPVTLAARNSAGLCSRRIPNTRACPRARAGRTVSRPSPAWPSARNRREYRSILKSSTGLNQTCSIRPHKGWNILLPAVRIIYSCTLIPSIWRLRNATRRRRSGLRATNSVISISARIIAGIWVPARSISRQYSMRWWRLGMTIPRFIHYLRHLARYLDR